MIFQPTKLRDVFVLEMEKREDHRGFFARTWCEKEFDSHGLTVQYVQANISFTKRRGSVRGLHYQVAPHPEIKLIRCTKGAIYDVIVDLRPTSPTYKQWLAVELTADNHRMLHVPAFFAHGFQTLKDETEVFYQVSGFYASECERGVRWDDPLFGIEWPETEKVIITDKDRNWPDYRAGGQILEGHSY